MTVRRGARWGIFVGVTATVVVADQLTKAWVAGAVAPDSPIEIVDSNLRLIITHNTGGLFGLFQGNALLFALVSLAVIAAIVVVQARAGTTWLTSLTFGLLLGGAIGNLIDRLRSGYVLDFVDAGIGDLRWFTFNVADAAISTSIVLLILVALFPGLDRWAGGLGGPSGQAHPDAVGPDGGGPHPAASGGAADPRSDAR